LRRLTCVVWLPSLGRQHIHYTVGEHVVSAEYSLYYDLSGSGRTGAVGAGAKTAAVASRHRRRDAKLTAKWLMLRSQAVRIPKAEV
jgi:hypothetical protein